MATSAEREGAIGDNSDALSVRDALIGKLLSSTPAEAALIRQGLAALDLLDGAATANPPMAQGAPPFVAIIGIDRLGVLQDELGDNASDGATGGVIARLRALIEAALEGASIGRVNRSSMEVAFHAPSDTTAEQRLRALHDELERFTVAGREVGLDVAIGFAHREAEQDTLETLVDRAEYALAKARGGAAKVAGYSRRDGEERAERMALLRDLRSAIAGGELFVVYQPKLTLRERRIESAEALVRWRHAGRGMVAPDLFIPLAEESGAIRQITETVVLQALADAGALRAAGHALVINVNISGRLVADDAFAAWAIERLGEAQGAIGFEITETAVIANPERALAHIRAFSAAGIKIAIDDYGSGLSSLSYLKQIPADELKIDRAFVSALTTSQRDPLLVRSTIDLAHALEMQVTAEGVDNPMALALLQVMGCDQVQGYHVSKPLTFEEIGRFVADFDSASVLKVRAPGIPKRV